MSVWSFWIGLIVAIVGLVFFGGFAHGRWCSPARTPGQVGAQPGRAGPRRTQLDLRPKEGNDDERTDKHLDFLD
jgi:hypothetical protein